MHSHTQKHNEYCVNTHTILSITLCGGSSTRFDGDDDDVDVNAFVDAAGVNATYKKMLGESSRPFQFAVFAPGVSVFRNKRWSNRWCINTNAIYASWMEEPWVAYFVHFAKSTNSD